MLNNQCSKIHRQKGFDLILFAERRGGPARGLAAAPPHQDGFNVFELLTLNLGPSTLIPEP